MFVGQAKAFFEVPKGYVAVDALDGEKIPEYVQRQGAEVLFDGAHETERWDVRFRHKELEVEHFTYQPQKDEKGKAIDGERKIIPSKSGDRFVILCTRRGERIVPMFFPTRRVREISLQSRSISRNAMRHSAYWASWDGTRSAPKPR
ncbi:MAG: hypothetical protein MPW16_04020 [Candidatus Manganitrophus sp.]|nr:MAG: hypothetical protein MPW16_04020 [Candidatus Manganitrophus sp.]